MRGGRGPAKVEPIRPGKALGVPMITLGAAHVLEDCLEEPGVEEERARAVAELRNDFFHPELGVLLECVGPDGELIDHLDGRHVNPGHSIEAAWFLMEEARRRGAPEVLTDAVRVLDGAWALGWDDEHGGLLSLVDVSGRPVQELWAELKLWWPHCEAIIACLCAARATGEERHVDRWRQVNDWAHAHFPDPEHGEWFGYLRRDGSVMNEAKGNMWKGPFHVPRMQWMASELCDAMAGSREE
jgi:N-acylglucosamine 2-epimerase